MTTQPYGQQAAQSDAFSDGEKVPAVSWRQNGVDVPPGFTHHLRVAAAAKRTETRNFETGAIERWDPKPGQTIGDPKWSVVVQCVDMTTGQELGLWCGVKSALYFALKKAQEDAGQQLAPGGTLAVTFTGNGVRSDGNTRMNPPKQFSAVYTPPAPGAGADAFGEAAPVQQYAQPAPAAQPVQQYAAPAQAAPVAQPVQQPVAQPVQAAPQPAAQPAGSAYSAEQLAAFRSIVETQGGNADATLRAIGQDPAAVRVALGLPPY